MDLRRAIGNWSSVSWLAMDCLWASGHPSQASCLAPVAMAMHVWPWPKTAREISGYTATIAWLSMNIAWMIEDSFKLEWLTSIKLGLMFLSITATIIWITSETKWN